MALHVPVPFYKQPPASKNTALVPPHLVISLGQHITQNSAVMLIPADPLERQSMSSSARTEEEVPCNGRSGLHYKQIHGQRGPTVSAVDKGGV